MRMAAAILVAALTAWCVDASTNEASAQHNLTLEQAIRIALTNHPHLAEAHANIESARARASAAGKLPNPEAVVRMESAPLSSGTTSQAEYVAGVSQTIPLGRKLSAARQVEEAGLQLREKQLEASALNLTKSVRNAFATALYASEVLKAQTNLGANVRELLRITKARVEQGDTPALDLARLEAEEAEQRLQIKEAAYLHHEALDALATALGDFTTAIQSLAGNLEESLQLLEIRASAAMVDMHPGVAAMESAASAQRARVRLVKAERVPDVNLDLFYRRMQGTRENAFDVGIRVPIPLFGRTRSRVREAEGELRAAEARVESTRNEIGHDLHARELALERALETVAVLKVDVLPKVNAILRGAEARYKAGDISLSELMVIRREATLNQMKYFESLRGVMEAWAGLRGT
jgi:cobalt-zinc-cadmium efflux system outer membrane protein